MQNLQNINFDNYGYTIGGTSAGNGSGMENGAAAGGSSPFQDLMSVQRSTPGSVHMAVHEQGLSPPYSNQSPPHSVQSNMALSPQGYIGKCAVNISPDTLCILVIIEHHFLTAKHFSPASHRLSLTRQATSLPAHLAHAHPGDAPRHPPEARR